MTESTPDVDPLEPLDDEDSSPRQDDPEETRDQTDAKLGDEHPGAADPNQLPPPVPGP